MLPKEAIKKAREARRPELVFDGPDYSISRIPLNFRIYIKPVLKKRIPNHGIDRDCYSDPGLGIEEAHEVAKKYIQEYFIMPD